MLDAIASPDPLESRKLTFQSFPVSDNQASKPALTRCSDCAAEVEWTQAMSIANAGPDAASATDATAQANLFITSSLRSKKPI